jgi:hypothetical protein
MFLARPGFRHSCRLDNPLIARGIDFYAMRAKARLGGRHYTRKMLYREFFDDADFRGVYNARVFWTADAFA